MIILGSLPDNRIIWTVLGERMFLENYIKISLIVVVIRTKPVFYKDGFLFLCIEAWGAAFHSVPFCPLLSLSL